MLTRRAFLASISAAGYAAAIAPSLLLADRWRRHLSTRLVQAPSPGLRQQYSFDVADVEYRRDGDTVFLARVYQPLGVGPFPVLVAIHGGQWTSDDRTSDASIATQLAARGMLIFSPDFRNGTPATPYPVSMEDVNYASRWIKVHASEFNGSPDRVGGLGTSSGGHLTMLSAMRASDQRYTVIPLPQSPEVDASLSYLVLISPVLDPLGRLIFAHHLGRPDIIRSTRVYFEPMQTILDASPMDILQRGEAVQLPPTLIIHGTADTSVPLALQERFAAAYRQAGGQIELDVFPDQPHVFPATPGPDSDRAFQLIEEFVARQHAA